MVGYLNVTINRKTRKRGLEIGTTGSRPSWQNQSVDWYGYGFGPTTLGGSTHWMRLKLNGTVFAVQTGTAGMLPGPIANTTREAIFTFFQWCKKTQQWVLHTQAQEYRVVIPSMYKYPHDWADCIDVFIRVFKQTNMMHFVLVEVIAARAHFVQKNAASGGTGSVWLVNIDVDLNTYWTVDWFDWNAWFRCVVVRLIIKLYYLIKTLYVIPPCKSGSWYTRIILETCVVVPAAPKFYQLNGLTSCHSEDNLMLFRILLYSILLLQKALTTSWKYNLRTWEHIVLHSACPGASGNIWMVSVASPNSWVIQFWHPYHFTFCWCSYWWCS